MTRHDDARQALTNVRDNLPTEMHVTRDLVNRMLDAHEQSVNDDDFLSSTVVAIARAVSDLEAKIEGYNVIEPTES